MTSAPRLLVPLLLSFLVAVVLTPAVRRVAIALGALDNVHGSRRVHGRPVPRVGGLAIVAGFYVSLGLTILAPFGGGVVQWTSRSALGLAAAGLGIAFLGLYDDFRGADAAQKFTVQIAVAILLYTMGFRADVIANPFGADLSTGMFSLPLTVLWIVGVTNAMNLVDGLDGLAGGIAVVAAAAIVVISARGSDFGTMVPAVALAGGALGFLVYNVAPASIFMGDTGSLFLGTMIAALSLRIGHGDAGAVPLAAMALVLGVPIGDTVLAMFRRGFRGVPMFRADREHVHHKLLSCGLSARRAVVALWTFSVILAGAGVQLASESPVGVRVVVFFAVVLGSLVALSRIGQFPWPDRGWRTRRAMNRKRLRQIHALSNRLLATRTLAATCKRVGSAKVALGAERVELHAPRYPRIAGRDVPPASAHVEGGHTVHFPIDERAPRRGFLEVTWRDPTPLDRDTELAIEILCQTLSYVLHRFEPRRPAFWRTAVVRSSVLREVSRMRRARQVAFRNGIAGVAAPPSVLFVVNDAEFFLHHRGMLADAVRGAGYDVHVACPTEPGAGSLALHGFTHHPLRLERAGRNPVQELRTAAELYRIFRRIRPRIVHLITFKAVLYGGIAARLARIPAAVFAVPGMGYTYLARGPRARVERFLIWTAYRLALGHRRSRLVVQNRDDGEVLAARASVRRERIALVPGNGIDLDEFAFRPESPGKPVVILPARMLWDKGVGEFVEAARMLRRLDVQARFVLVGSAASRNPSAISLAQLEQWVRDEVVEWWGHRDDMPSVLASAHVVCLPSYREGIPRALIEAAACGRPIVTTDVPGCREVVRHGVNGFLVPPRRPAPLAAALERLLFDGDLRRRFGERGRRIVETEMSADATISPVLEIYGELGGKVASASAPPRRTPATDYSPSVRSGS